MVAGAPTVVRVISLRWLDALDGADGEAFAGVVACFWEEVIPGERPVPLSELRAMVERGSQHRRFLPLLARDGQEAVGAALLVVHELRPQGASVRFLFVHPEHRRRGFGTRLLEGVGARARADGRTRLRTLAIDGHMATAGFAARAGARPGLRMEQRRCPLGRLPRDELRRWVSPVPGYSLVSFDGVCPDEHLEAFAEVVPVMNTAPQGVATATLAPGPDDVRRMMDAHVRLGNESWTVCARDDRTGRFVGYTELSVSTHRPWRATQGDTGVDPAHRRQGLGRWLKAQTALRLLQERPDVEYIETWNAAENGPMISINRTMGFEVVARWREWDLPPFRD
jgi:GNAT superfamily N-acetyltransferase